jgi:hypothetical protein
MSSLRRILDAQAAVSKVTKVTVKSGKTACAVLALGCLAVAAAQQPAPAQIQGPAESLYLKLRRVGLDKARVFTIREAALDRASLHITLDDGMIAFAEDAGGQVTGAFFQGYGEILLSPPNTMERASLARFTGAAILEESFSTAYFRFNDDLYTELKPFLRTADDPAAFATQWNMTAQNLAQEDALRLLLTFSDGLPPETSPSADSGNDHFLHAMIEGNKLGTFDVRYDALLSEQIQAGQFKRVEGRQYYNMWTSFTVPAPGKAQLSHDVAEPANSSFEITGFKIKAEVRPVKELAATAVLSITVHQSRRRALMFELSRLLQVKEVLADGKPIEFIHNQAIEGSQLEKRGNDVIAVILPSSLHAGQKLELSFEYSGSVLSEAANGLLYVGDHGTWYPNRGFAMASFDMEFKYPQQWTLVATGRRREDRSESGEQFARWITDRPVPVAGFNLGKYSQAATQAGSVTVLTYATSTVEKGFAALSETLPSQLPGFLIPRRPSAPLTITIPPPAPSPAQNAQAVGQTSARAVEFYEKHFGKFPYGQLALTQMPGTVSQGWPGLIFLSSYSFLNPQERSQLHMEPGRRLISEQVIAHETAHQWWGDLVTWSSYRDQWIMEGLANYSAMMLLESRDHIKFRQVMDTYREELLAKDAKGVPMMDAGPVTLGARLSSSQFPDAYENICYGRGTWLFHMLRTMMRDGEKKSSAPGHSKAGGDEPFMRALRQLRAQYEDKAVSTSELMKIFEAELPSSLWYEGHKSLDWFYEGWVNGSSMPSLSLRNVKFTERGSATVAMGTVVQEYAPDNLVTAVPLYASIAGKSVFLGRVFAEGKETAFHISAPAGVRKLLIDPEQTLLSRK